MVTHHDTNGHANGTSRAGDSSSAKPHSFDVRILRQDAPGEKSYWERFKIPYSPEMNVISVLQKVAEMSRTSDGRAVAPVAWDCNCLEEVCGACTMVINGRVRQACSALVDKLLVEHPGDIELRPMSKFPVIRDLLVDRSRLFRALKKIQGWIPVDGYFDRGPGPTQSPEQQEIAYPLSECMSCGCCLDACPQYTKIELERREGESDEQFRSRKEAAFDQGFIGAHAISQAMYFNAHPVGKMSANARLFALTSEGGVQVCGNAQNCVAVCPKSIPLTTSIARAGRAATVYSIKSWLER